MGTEARKSEVGVKRRSDPVHLALPFDGSFCLGARGDVATCSGARPSQAAVIKHIITVALAVQRACIAIVSLTEKPVRSDRVGCDVIEWLDTYIDAQLPRVWPS